MDREPAMKSGIRTAVLLLSFLLALTLLVASRSRTLGLFLALGFYAAGSAKVLIQTITKKPADSYARAGWGNGLAAFPASWQRWLLDEPRK